MCIFEILDSFLGMEIKKMKHLQVIMSDHHNAVDFLLLKQVSFVSLTYLHVVKINLVICF